VPYTTVSTHKTYEATVQALHRRVAEGTPLRKLRIIAEEPRITEEPGLGRPVAGRILVVILAGAAFGLVAGILASIAEPTRGITTMVVMAAWGSGLGSLAALIAEIVTQAVSADHYIVAASAFRIEKAGEGASPYEGLPQKLWPMETEERDILI
jgi:hypothetical protein